MGLPLIFVSLFVLALVLFTLVKRPAVRFIAISTIAACVPVLFWLFHNELRLPAPRFLSSSGMLSEGRPYHEKIEFDLGRGSYVVSARYELPGDGEGIELTHDFSLGLAEMGNILDQTGSKVSLNRGLTIVELGGFRVDKTRDELELVFFVPAQPETNDLRIQLLVERM